MTDSRADSLVPYSRFVECRDRRHRLAIELTQPRQPPTDAPEILSELAEAVAVQPPVGNNVER